MCARDVLLNSPELSRPKGFGIGKRGVPDQSGGLIDFRTYGGLLRKEEFPRTALPTWFLPDVALSMCVVMPLRCSPSHMQRIWRNGERRRSPFTSVDIPRGGIQVWPKGRIVASDWMSLVCTRDGVSLPFQRQSCSLYIMFLRDRN